MRTTGFPCGRFFGSKVDVGMLTAFGMCPAANSCGSRTSMTVQALQPTASSRSPKLTTSGSEPAPKRENMFQDMIPPRSCGRQFPAPRTARRLRTRGSHTSPQARLAYRSPRPAFRGFSTHRAAIGRYLDVDTDAIVKNGRDLNNDRRMCRQPHLNE